MKVSTKNTQTLAAAAPTLGVKQNTSKINSVGGVSALGQNAVFGTPLPPVISFTLDNSANASPATYLLFDALGLNSSEIGGTLVAPDSVSAGSHAALKESLKASPMMFKGFNYRITTGTAAQFSEKFLYSKASLSGEYGKRPFFPQTALRNTQQNDKLLTLENQILVDQYSALVIDVAANTEVVLEFFTEAVLNTL